MRERDVYQLENMEPEELRAHLVSDRCELPGYGG